MTGWITNTFGRLMALKEKLKQQRNHLDELDRHMYATSTAVPCLTGLDVHC